MNNYIMDHTYHIVKLHIDSTNKDAIRSVVKSYFGKDIEEKDLNEDGTYTIVIDDITDEEIKADID